MSALLLLLLALLGHAFLWIGLVNRLHALGIRRWIIKLATLAFFLCAVLFPPRSAGNMCNTAGSAFWPAAT